VTLHVVGILVANALLFGLGVGLLLLLDLWRRFSRWTRPAVALLVGQASFAAAAPLLLYARLSVSPLVVEPLIALVLAAGVVVERRRQLPPEPRPGGGGWIGLVLAGPPLLLLAVRAAYHPLFQFDTISNWVTKATVIWAGGHRLTGVLDPRFFARPDLHPQSHLEYPLGMNALFAWDIHWMGVVDTRVIHLQLVVVLAAAAGTAWALLRPLVPALPLAAGLAGLIMMPAQVDRLLSAYADLPLACVWAVGAIALLRWVAEGERYLLVLATVLLCGALALKQDAVFYDAAVYVAIAAALALRQRRRLVELALSGGIVALSALPWRVYTAVHGLRSGDVRPGLERMRHETGNLSPTAHGIVHVLTSRGTLFAVPLAAAFALACLARRRRDEAAPFLATGALVLTAVVLVYWNGAVSLPLVLVPALPRILTGLVVLAWLLLPVLVHEALRLDERGEEARLPARARRTWRRASGRAPSPSPRRASTPSPPQRSP
jgi:hypothetical protein